MFAELARHGDVVRTLELACGQCIGCRLDRSRAWASRCVHESQCHDENSFVTLTYRDVDLPPFLSLHYPHVQLFLKRLRKARGPFRYFVCGEYGEKYSRPHYHALFFGLNFPDRYYWRMSDSGFRLYRSPELELRWGLGDCEIGDVSFESAAYVARYVMKKELGCEVGLRRSILDVTTGELVERDHEFAHMSLKPGIGSTWLDRYWSDVFPDGRIVMNGHKVDAPKFYARRFKKLSGDTDEYARSMLQRELRARANAADRTVKRLAVREVVDEARVGLLVRKL